MTNGPDARHQVPAPAPYRRGAYTPANTDATYLALLHRAEHLMRLGHAVVLDATWRDAQWRVTAALIAGRCAADLVELRCEAPPGVIETRITARSDARSDLTVEVSRRVVADFDAWPTAVRLGTTDDPQRALAGALHAVAAVARSERRPVLGAATG